MSPTIVMTRMGRQAWSDPAKSGPMLARTPMGKFAGNPLVKLLCNVNIIIVL